MLKACTKAADSRRSGVQGSAILIKEERADLSGQAPTFGALDRLLQASSSSSSDPDLHDLFWKAIKKAE